MDRHNVRKRVEPMRFGRKANKSDLSKSDSSNNLFCDDSQDDKNYTPEKKNEKHKMTPRIRNWPTLI